MAQSIRFDTVHWLLFFILLLVFTSVLVQFYWLQALVDGNQHIRIREKNSGVVLNSVIYSVSVLHQKTLQFLTGGAG